jgi:hypothetical protein
MTIKKVKLGKRRTKDIKREEKESKDKNETPLKATNTGTEMGRKDFLLGEF